MRGKVYCNKEVENPVIIAPATFRHLVLPAITILDLSLLVITRCAATVIIFIRRRSENTTCVQYAVSDMSRYHPVRRSRSIWNPIWLVPFLQN